MQHLELHCEHHALVGCPKLPGFGPCATKGHDQCLGVHDPARGNDACLTGSAGKCRETVPGLLYEAHKTAKQRVCQPKSTTGIDRHDVDR